VIIVSCGKHEAKGLTECGSSLPCNCCGFHSPPSHASVYPLWFTQLLWGSLGDLVILKVVDTKRRSKASKGGTMGDQVALVAAFRKRPPLMLGSSLWVNI
jgi:hypothetical protein